MADQSRNERNILIVGVVLGLAAAALGGYTMSSSKALDVDTQLSGKSDGDSLTAEAEETRATLQRDRGIADVAPEGATVNGKPRVMPFFFSTELWQIPPQNGGTLYNVVDIYDPTVPELHEGIPNTWFLKYGLVDALSASNGADLDSDGDGFTNREEFADKTDPSKADSLPPLVQATAGKPVKLEVVKVEKAKAIITVDSMFASDPSTISLKIFKRIDDQKPILKKEVKVGETFGLGEKANAKRFTVLGVDKKSFTGSGGTAEENVLRVRDNEAIAPADKEFTIRAGRPRANDKDRGTPSEKGHAINDVAAQIRVTAGPMAGKPEGTVRVPLYGSFKVPGDAKVTCTLQSIDANGNANILPEGAQSPVNIPAAAK